MPTREAVAPAIPSPSPEDRRPDDAGATRGGGDALAGGSKKDKLHSGSALSPADVPSLPDPRLLRGVVKVFPTPPADPDPPSSAGKRSGRAWYWDNKVFNAAFFGASGSGHCHFCYRKTTSSSASGRGETSLEVEKCCALYNYCDKECREMAEYFKPINCACDRVEVRLVPSCDRRRCRNCINARSKNRQERPCPMDLRMLWEDAKAIVNNQGQAYSYYKAIQDMFQLFLNFLYKHEDDVMAVNAKKLSYFNNTNPAFNNPAANIIHLYVTVLVDLLEPHSVGWKKGSFLGHKLLAFYNKLTWYHREMDLYTKFLRKDFAWWNTYLVNWGELSRWLLAVAFTWTWPGECCCEARQQLTVSEPISPVGYHLPRQQPSEKEKGRSNASLSMPVMGVTEAGERCAVCHTVLGAGREYRHWMEEFLASDKGMELPAFPIQRLAANVVTEWDFQIMLANDSKVPVGFVCSQLCFQMMESNSFPHRMRRLSMCRRKGCTNINIRKHSDRKDGHLQPNQIKRHLRQANRDLTLTVQAMDENRVDQQTDTQLLSEIDERSAERELEITAISKNIKEQPGALGDLGDLGALIREVQQSVKESDMDLQQVKQWFEDGKYLKDDSSTAPKKKAQSAMCRFGCVGVGESSHESPLTPAHLSPVYRAEGSFTQCDLCKQEKTLTIECHSCAAVAYCSTKCHLKENTSHSCSERRAHNFNRILHFGGQPFVAKWEMAKTGHIDLFKFVKNCHRCRPCFPHTMQLVLSKSRTKQYLTSYFPLAVQNVFGFHKLGNNRDTEPFSVIHLGTVLDLLEQMLEDFNNPELRARNNVEELLSMLMDVQETWFSDFQHQQVKETENFYDYDSIMSMDAALKYCQAYATSLCAHAFMAQVEDDGLAAQQERAGHLRRLWPMFIELISCQQSSPLVSTLRQRPHLADGGDLVSIRVYALENFSRIFSYCSSHIPSPDCIRIDLLPAILHGQEQSVEVKPLESRVSLTITLIGWFHSKYGQDFKDLVREFAAVVEKHGLSHPRRLYYQPNPMGPPENQWELPTTLLQNYVILIYSLALQLNGARLIQETDLLGPLADLLCHELKSRTPATVRECRERSRTRRQRLVHHMQDGRLFNVPVVDMLKMVYESVTRRLSFSRVKVFLEEGGPFMRLVRAIGEVDVEARQQLAVQNLGLEGFHQKQMQHLQKNLQESLDKRADERKETD